MEATTYLLLALWLFVGHGVVFVATSLGAGFSWMRRSRFNDLRLILTSPLFLKSLRKLSPLSITHSVNNVYEQQRNSIIKNDLWPPDDSCFLTIVVLLDLSVALMRFLALSFRRDLHLLNRLACFTTHLSDITQSFCWCATGFRFGASFIPCLHASTQTYSISFHCYTDDAPLYIFPKPNFTLPRISLCDSWRS